MTGQVLDILVGGVYNFGQFLSVDHLFINIHGNSIIEIAKPGAISTDNLSDRRAPATEKFISSWR